MILRTRAFKLQLNFFVSLLYYINVLDDDLRLR